MTPEKQAQMDAHVRVIAKLLHADAKAEVSGEFPPKSTVHDRFQEWLLKAPSRKASVVLAYGVLAIEV